MPSPFPKGSVTYLINHPHPGGNSQPSIPNIKYLIDQEEAKSKQKSSVILQKNRPAARFNKTTPTIKNKEMKSYSPEVIREVENIMQNNYGNLVLVKRKGTGSNELVSKYSITNKWTHSYFLIDNKDVEDFLINELQDQNVEIFEDFAHLERASPKKVPKPMFWPEDKPWPPGQK